MPLGTQLFSFGLFGFTHPAASRIDPERQEIAPPPRPAAPDTRDETDREYQQRQESFFWGFYPMF